MNHKRDPPVAPIISTTYDEVLVAYTRTNTAAVRLEAEVEAVRSSGSSLKKGEIPAVGLDDARKRLDALEIMVQVNFARSEVEGRKRDGSVFLSNLH